MKRIIAVAVALMALSCSKDAPYSISPEDLVNDPMKIAKTTITTKGDEYEDTVTSFETVKVYRESEAAGKSHFIALSGGKMVYDAFMLSFDFNSIDTVKVGEMLVPFPKRPVDIEVFMVDIHRQRTSYLKHRIDPSDILIRKMADNGNSSAVVWQGGSLAETIDIVVVSEGYDATEKAKFYRDAERVATALFGHQP